MASSTSDSFAVKIYSLICSEIFEELEKLCSEVDVFIFYSEIDNKDNILNWVKRDFYYYEQFGNNLGEKMFNAFETVFKKEYTKAIIIGTDVPDINSDIIKNAFLVLDNYNAVISPSKDGGYSLLGLKQNYKFLFENIQWSTNSVYYNTSLKMKQNNVNCKKLEILDDIDTKEELSNWLQTAVNNKLKPKIEQIALSEGIKL